MTKEAWEVLNALLDDCGGVARVLISRSAEADGMEVRIMLPADLSGDPKDYKYFLIKAPVNINE